MLPEKLLADVDAIEAAVRRAAAAAHRIVDDHPELPVMNVRLVFLGDTPTVVLQTTWDDLDSWLAAYRVPAETTLKPPHAVGTRWMHRDAHLTVDGAAVNLCAARLVKDGEPE